MSPKQENDSVSLEAMSVYRQLFLNAAEGLVLTDYRGVIVEVNPRCNEMFGYTEVELIGQKIEVLIPEDARGRHRGHRNEFAQSPSNRSMGSGMSLSGRKKDGTTFSVEISLNHFGSGSALKVMALISDITRRVEAEKRVKELNEKLEHKVEERTQELLRSQNLYVAIARNFPDGTISVFDKDLNYIFFEGKELYQAGIESEKLIGTSIKDRLPEDVKGAVIEHLDNVFSGESGIIEFETKGQVFEINAVPLIDSGGNIKQILVVERNITKQKRAENEILNALAQERALNELKSRFVSMASHEFRTPLSTILSSISLINKYNVGENDEKIDKHIGRIRSSVQNLTGILNDFLSLDKLEEGKIRTNVTEINIRDMVEDLMDELEAVMKSGQKVDVNCDIEKEVISIDGQIIKNILINLTSNAIKYSPENSIIKLTILIKNGEMEIAVSDNGIGIPPEEQHHLFERFFRAKNVTNIGGTGLGLNIVRKYVDLLNGDINFISELGKGTTFVVNLPLD
jgi:PAS domain S-box-containing protein